MSNQDSPDANTTAWNIQVWVSWALAFAMTLGGAMAVGDNWWARGYLAMGVIFLVGSTFNLAKTTRDNAEARKLRNRVRAAKTEKVLREFEVSEAA